VNRGIGARSRAVGEARHVPQTRVSRTAGSCESYISSEEPLSVQCVSFAAIDASRVFEFRSYQLGTCCRNSGAGRKRFRQSTTPRSPFRRGHLAKVQPVGFPRRPYRPRTGHCQLVRATNGTPVRAPRKSRDDKAIHSPLGKITRNQPLGSHHRSSDRTRTSSRTNTQSPASRPRDCLAATKFRRSRQHRLVRRSM